MQSKTMLSLLAAVVLAQAAVITGALAHVKNEETQFPDIEASDARYDIVLLTAAGIIPQTPVFEPDQSLTRRDLAAWVALAQGLGKGGETPDTDALARAALSAGAVSSIEGVTTFGELSEAFFDGRASVDEQDETPTKAEAVRFVATHLTTPVNGATLLAHLGLIEGPTGEIARVESEKAADGHSAYIFTIGGETVPAYEHIRVANGPTDLLVWEQRAARRSFLRQIEGTEFLVYLEAEPRDPSAATAAAAGQGKRTAATDAKPSATGGLFYSLIAAVVILAVLLFGRRSRKG
jgi:hypothetical protein